MIRPSTTGRRGARSRAVAALLATLTAAALTAAACGAAESTGTSRGPDPESVPVAESAPVRVQDTAMISVRVFDAAGQLVGPISVPRVVKSDAQWRAQLTPEQYRIARGAGTEARFCGTLLDNKKEGVYACICCDLPLFSSDSKFESGTGWPSFFQPISRENVIARTDRSHGMMREEINCARCDGHLGHVFEDGPRPTGLRFCLNSESLRFVGKSDQKTLADPAAGGAGAAAAAPGARATAVFAGGCFWCVEAVFEELAGVIDAVSGYAGGSAETANYEDVCTGKTGHAEAVQIEYEPSVISYVDLLKVHFATHDPTTLNRQGPDSGPQYRSAIFYASDQEKELAQAFLDDLAAAKAYERRIVTTLEPLERFYPAEAYHQNYVCQNPNQGYVRGVALPKVEKVRAKFGDKLKATSPLER